MAGYPLPTFDPTQQLNQDPTQGQAPGSQPPPQQQPPQAPSQNQGQPSPSQGQQGPQGGDPLEQVRQSLAARIAQNQQQAQTPANNGGRIKQLLGNFLSGAGTAMMHDAGIPTPYEQNQKDILNLNAISTTQANADLHRSMAGMYGTVPIQVPDASDPSGFSTINVMQKDVGKIQQAQIAAARTGAAQIGAGARIGAAQIMAGPQVPTSPAQQQIGLPPTLPLRFANQAQQMQLRPLQTVQGEQGPAVINKLNPGAPPVQVPGVGNPRAMFAPGNRYVPVVDPNNPDNVTYTTAAQAARSGAASPQSVGFQANKAVTKSAISGPIGNEINAQQTAIQHATLLQQAVSALGNGDTQALNKLKNSFATQFGATGPITAQTIANAYGREVTKMLTSGHMTDAEISSAGGTLDVSRMSPAQMGSVIGAYKALAASKMQMRQQQVERGKQGQPNFPSTGPAPTGGAPSFAQWKASQR